ncbi:hypothetical protein [Leucobacter chromiireducens]|uniref:hypothetical protein n=1 Tax=Leucobacter chromiireducens TaxID=283877 RepID=UPI000F6350CF|nr:hypothetical protein [Leucobacter chromiireducens]
MTQETARELDRIRRMPYGTARTAAAEALTRRVEAEGPKAYLAEALLDLVEAYSFADDGAKSFVVFARALRLWDESPELFDAADEQNLFWEFKWVASDLPEYPQITAAQAEAFLADMERRFTLAGHGLSSVRMSWFRWAWHAGRADAEAQRIAWISGLRDEFEDCAACTIGQQVDFFVDTDRMAEAVTLGRTQRDSCNLEPARTRYALALALLLEGDPVAAERVHKQALAADDGDTTDFPAARGQGFEMLARGGRIEQALRILRSDYPDALRRGASPALHLRFIVGVLAGLSANLDRGELATGFAEPEWRTVAELHAWVLAAAERLAGPLDARNGTDMYARRIARALAARRVAAPLPAAVAEPAVVSEPVTEPPVSAPGRAAPVAETDQHGSERADRADGAAALATAETLAARGQHGAAARAYAAAAEQLEGEGWLGRAGVAYAEAAQHASLDQDEEAAHMLFAAAVPRLRAGDADPEVRVAVLTAWAPVAARMADSAAHLTATAEELDMYTEFDGSGLSEELAERRRADWSTQRAELRDVLARAIGAALPEHRPTGLTPERALAEATRAGEEFAQLGRVADAAHAFWLAGKLHREAGDTGEAVWALESAFEGFTIARVRDARAAVASELIELLRASGQDDRADRVIADL